MRRVLPLLAVLALAPVARAEPIELRLATLAPNGSSWAKIMQEGDRRLGVATEGRVRFRIYFSGSQGDERDVVRKMKLGQLDGGALTAVGLGMILPEVLVLQLPYLFTSEKQLDHVRDVLTPELTRRLDEAGFVLVAWGDVGWVHTYFTVPVAGAADFKGIEFAQWVDDPISREMLAVLGVNGVPLGIADIRMALQTGAVQACAAPPLAAVALQWYPKLAFMTDRPSSYAIGALVLRKAAFERLTADDRQRLLDGARATGQELVASVRRDNERAKRAISKSGVQMIAVPPDVHERLVGAGKEVWKRLTGKLYSQALLDRVVALAAEAR
jgi:TRAP-type transport system periplasmic protein